jgi:hypothetical protein
MATLEDAEAARKAHQDRLAAMGAHAIEIQPQSDLTSRNRQRLLSRARW